MVAADRVGAEVISVVERRRRWTTEDKLALVEAAAQPGASVAATADRHGVSRSLLFDWRRQPPEGTMSGLVGTTADPTFAPVRVVQAPRTPTRSSAAATPTRRSPPGGGMMELVLTNGHGPQQHRRWASAWSPQQISQRLRLGFPDDETMRISHEAILPGAVRAGPRRVAA